jgi:peptidyl-prolyl cis-trans isomerase A (cyclophilin A)
LKLKKYRSALAALSLSFLIPLSAQATVVEVRTVLGNIQVNLFDETTPASVANFLDYVNSGAYANNVVHRVEPGFVAQAGGFQYNKQIPLDAVPAGIPVVNEPELSNVRGTIAMAKQGGDPNSATSQWFFNLSNNSGNLDAQNGGFTVFGQVISDGMQVVDAIAGIPRYNGGGAFTSWPLRDYDGSSDIGEQNLVLITDVVVINAATVTNPQLKPALNTSNNTSTPSNGGDSDSGGGGSVTWLLALLGLALLRKRQDY